MSCPICDGVLRPVFTAKVLHKYLAEYECCTSCGFLRVREPHWLDEAYSSAIAAADTGLVVRNVSLASKIATVLYVVLGERGNGRYLDAAGGYGMLTRMMRDIGYDFYWSDEYCENLLSRGFEYDYDLGACRAVTAMEVMEHLVNPVEFVEEVLGTSRADVLLFSTELYGTNPPAPEDWWYYTLATGQHIGFFQRRTLDVFAKRLGFHLTSAHGIHAFSRQPLDSQRFALATNPFISRLATPWIRYSIGSRTFDDHNRIMHKI